MTKVTVAVLALTVCVPGLRAEDKAAVLKKLQGTWRIVSGTIDEDKLGEAQVLGGTLVIEGTKYKMRNKKGEDPTMPADVGTFAIDPSKTPAQIDLTYDFLGSPTTGKGIYALDGDSLKICYDFTTENRPGNFEAKKGQVTLVLKREK